MPFGSSYTRIESGTACAEATREVKTSSRVTAGAGYVPRNAGAVWLASARYAAASQPVPFSIIQVVAGSGHYNVKGDQGHMATLSARPVLFVAALLFAGCSSMRAQPGESDIKLAQDADAYLTRVLSSKRIPGMSVCIVRNGKTVLARGYGFANLELSARASEHTVFELASLTKPFTATAVMMLVEAGEISLEDRLAKYFPALPSTWESVSVGHLLRHTSGFGDFFTIPELRSKSDFAWERQYELPDLLPILFKVPVQSQPGEKWSYSNVGYYLLGLIIEKVTGEPYESFLKHRVFEPLQMMETRRMDRRDIIHERAAGYTWENKVLRNAKFTSATWAYSEGGLVSSTSDLAKADAGLFGGKLLQRTTMEDMWQPSRLNDGSVAGYGYGWNVGSGPGRRNIFHSGNKPGFASIIRRYIDESLTIVVLANVDNGIDAGADVGAISFQVANIFLNGAKPH
jgi:D-alanyl-D-alanine carboxypeptidase